MISVRQRDLESALCPPTVLEQGSTGPLMVPTVSIHRPIQAEMDEVASLCVGFANFCSKNFVGRNSELKLDNHFFFGKILAENGLIFNLYPNL